MRDVRLGLLRSATADLLILFQIDEEHQTQIELEISLITSWKDTQVPSWFHLIKTQLFTLSDMKRIHSFDE